MKIVRNPSLHLQLLNALCFTVIMYTIVFGWIHINALPQHVHIPHVSAGDVLFDKSVFWSDIRLMVTSYLVISLISIYLKVIPFKNNKGQAMAIMASFINFCISLTFAVFIINALKELLI